MSLSGMKKPALETDHKIHTKNNDERYSCRK